MNTERAELLARVQREQRAWESWNREKPDQSSLTTAALLADVAKYLAGATAGVEARFVSIGSITNSKPPHSAWVELQIDEFAALDVLRSKRIMLVPAEEPALPVCTWPACECLRFLARCPRKVALSRRAASAADNPESGQ